jgi:hypothetical protein
MTYANEVDALVDTNRILVGNPWRESERPGGVRDYYTIGYEEGVAQFSGIVLHRGPAGTITGTLEDFTADPARTYQILATIETDVEYAWALEPVEAAGAFSIAPAEARPLQANETVKLRLVEQVHGCSVRVVGQVWAEENAAAGTAGFYPDLRVEYRGIGASIPAFPGAIVPARRDHTWSVPLDPPKVGRVSLVHVSTKRVLGQYTMPTGLMRSYNVPAADAGQNTSSVYYDGFMDACFLYDQAVALLAFLQMGQQSAAARLVDALLEVQNPDGSYPFANDQAALGVHNDGFIRNGAVAWVAYALLVADRPEYRAWWPVRTEAAARNCLDFLLAWRNSAGLLTGGRGQYVDGVLDPGYLIPWWSCEHNIDAWWTFDLAHQLYGDVAYWAAADQIKASLLSIGWNSANGIFWQGGGHDGNPATPDGAHALDTHTWGAALLDRWGLGIAADASLDRAYRKYWVKDPWTGAEGYSTFTPADGYPPETVKAVWYEGSYGAATAIRRRDPMRANELMALLAKGQRLDGSYPYAVRNDLVNDIHTFPSVIGSAWNIVAWSGAGTPNPLVIWK